MVIETVVFKYPIKFKLTLNTSFFNLVIYPIMSSKLFIIFIEYFEFYYVPNTRFSKTVENVSNLPILDLLSSYCVKIGDFMCYFFLGLCCHMN
jgi:hypothetical protein